LPVPLLLGNHRLRGKTFDSSLTGATYSLLPRVLPRHLGTRQHFLEPSMKRSYHSLLTRMLREAHAACGETAATGISMDETSDLRAGERQSRRKFLQGTGSALAATAFMGLAPRAARGSLQPRIAIVGAGLAGLRCAHKLRLERGLASTVYEWDDRIGGRVETLRDFFANGQIVEQHGEFISSEHSSLRRLAHRFGLHLENAGKAPSNTEDVYWFNGGYYTQRQLNHDWHTHGWKIFNSAVKQVPFPTLYDNYNSTGFQWDHMSVVDWIEQNVPGGMDSPFGRLCYEVTLSEYGGPPEQQSALNLIYTLGYDGSSQSGNSYQPKNSPVLSGTDELYHVRGGNDQIIQGLVSELPEGSVLTGQQLLALKLNSDGSYSCTFQSGNTTTDVSADHVVLAIPFTALRNVDLSRAGLSALKMRAIQNLQLGSTAKIQMQFTGRVWNQEGFTGGEYADNGAAVGWECTNCQRGETGILINFPAGSQAAAMPAKYGLTQDEQVAPPALVADTLSFLEPIFPGVTNAYNGLAYAAFGILDPRLGGAWSQYNIGQYTDFGGYEGVQEGNIHFAGEQTSIDFQGYMEGAVRSGERVAREI
jgi:monoamine oxidase